MSLSISTRIRSKLIPRVYVVIGDQMKYFDFPEGTPESFIEATRNREDFKEPGYPTDPDTYGLHLFESPPIDDDEKLRRQRSVKAFKDWDDAVDFAYHCNLDSVMIQVYERWSSKWVYMPKQSEIAVSSINW